MVTVQSGIKTSPQEVAKIIVENVPRNQIILKVKAFFGCV